MARRALRLLNRGSCCTSESGQRLACMRDRICTPELALYGRLRLSMLVSNLSSAAQFMRTGETAFTRLLFVTSKRLLQRESIPATEAASLLVGMYRLQVPETDLRRDRIG